MKFRGVISLRKLLPIWAMPNGILTRVLSSDVLEVDEDALGRFGAQEGRVLFAAHRADDRLEHQVEFARLGEAAFFELTGMLAGLLRAFGRLQVIGPPTTFARLAIDHHVVEQIVVPEHFQTCGCMMMAASRPTIS